LPSHAAGPLDAELGRADIPRKESEA
jgi:hypothetical protein